MAEDPSSYSLTRVQMNSDTDNISDELDFEFFGNRSGQPYTVQTNVYAHGKGDRKQRINLWFDPAAAFHTYSIRWSHQLIVFYMDDVPIRVSKNNEANGSHTLSLNQWECSQHYGKLMKRRVREDRLVQSSIMPTIPTLTLRDAQRQVHLLVSKILKTGGKLLPIRPLVLWKQGNIVGLE